MLTSNLRQDGRRFKTFGEGEGNLKVISSMEEPAEKARLSLSAHIAAAQIERLLSSSTFRQVSQLRTLLGGLASYAAQGRAEELTEKTIALDILGKGERYLNQIKRNSLISVEKARLARKLKDYYESEGRDDAVIISLPKRGFGLEAHLRTLEASPACQLFQKARHLWSSRRPSAIQEAIRLLCSALQLDAELAPAHAALADCYGHLALWGARPSDVLPRAREHAVKALNLDEESWEAHAALAAVHMCNWQWADAEREFDRALALNFSGAVLYPWHPALVTVLGRIDENLELARVLCAEDPIALEPKQMYALLLMAGGQDELALEVFRELAQLHPWFPIPYYYFSWIPLVQGKHDEAVEAARRLLEVTSGPYAQATLGMCCGFAGSRTEALQILQKLQAERVERYIPAGAISMLHIGLGEIEQALDQLETGIAEHEPYIMWFSKWPYQRSLSTHPRAPEIRRRMNLPK